MLGDTRMLDAAKQSIRKGFRDKASLPASDPTIQPAIQHAQAVASFLKANLVQGKRDGTTYSKQPGIVGADKILANPVIFLELRIHEHTERGDNESIKLAGNNAASLGGVKCCSEK